MRAIPVVIITALFCSCSSLFGATAALLGWNNLGMHCMDSDYSVFSILPPYNTVESQLVFNGRLVTNGGAYTVTYEAVADPDGSINSTAMGKGNFYTYATALYGASLDVEAGLAGWSMPGLSNAPQSMVFEQTNQPAPGVKQLVNWFRAEGIPLSPYDDAHRKNPYPLMRLIARNGTIIATNDVVLPVSDEMDCRACHASGTATGAQPAGGWVWNGLPERDYRLNILRLHDEREFAGHKGLYVEALAAKGFNPQGLYRGVIADGKPVLCAACHASEALGAPSYGTIPSLTASMHSYHAPVADPILKTTLDHAANRSVCYRCHPGSATKCLRGAMGGAVAPDGSMEMQCQNCHGTMTQVGALNRVGWFMEPNCQGCHSGTATPNSGQIRFASVFTDANGTVRVPTDRTFATQTNVPAPGISLYRFSAGHGGLQCSACHGSTHAEFPSTHGNDNVRNQQLQGHSGVLIECLSCHATMPNTPNRGPHGMHSVAQGWISGGGGVTKHASAISAAGGITACQSCHGAEYRGTVLSRAQTARTYTASLEGGSVTLQLYRGAIIGCYNCHNGPNGDQINNSVTPTVANVTTNTINDQALSFAPRITGSGAILRVISQPASGSVGCSNQVLTYFPAPGFAGTDHFTYSVYDGAKNSLLATGLVSVAQGQVTLGTEARAPGTYPAAWSVPFAVTPNVTNSLSVPTFDWDFGDGSLHAAGQFPTHAYAVAGSYNWKVVTQVGGVSAVSQGTIAITPPLMLQTIREGNDVTLSWPQSSADPVIEAASKVGPGSNWTVLTNVIAADAGMLKVRVPANGEAFYRLRRVW